MPFVIDKFQVNASLIIQNYGQWIESDFRRRFLTSGHIVILQYMHQTHLRLQQTDSTTNTVTWSIAERKIGHRLMGFLILGAEAFRIESVWVGPILELRYSDNDKNCLKLLIISMELYVSKPTHLRITLYAEDWYINRHTDWHCVIVIRFKIELIFSFLRQMFAIEIR